MKIELTVKKEFEVTTLLIDAGARYWEDTEVNGVQDTEGDLIPCRFGDRWKPIVDLETGHIINWELGKTAKIHYKICDDGEYWLRDSEGNQVVKSKGYYVPGFLSIGDNGFGDYIIMNIDKNGLIENFEIDLTEFQEEDED